MQDELRNELDRAWKSTCTVIFGKDLGGLEEYGPYLKEAVVGRDVASCLSGRKLWVSSERYCGSAKFLDYAHEAGSASKMMAAPLDIDAIKDIDSLTSQIRERWMYGANKLLGVSRFVEHSDDVVDGMNIFNSSMIINGRDQAYTYLIQNSEFAFGSTSSGQSSHIIRCYYNNTLKRCFEVASSVGLSDSMFCYNVMNSSDCMFCFNLRAKQNRIANIQLAKDQYAKLRGKLVGEIIDEMRRKKRLGFSLIEVINGDALD